MRSSGVWISGRRPPTKALIGSATNCYIANSRFHCSFTAACPTSERFQSRSRLCILPPFHCAMSEIRKVIGVLDQLVTNKNGIAFPSVRVWIRGANDYETHGLEQSFPERGTVYLHVSACENQHPQRNQVGLFNCVESPGQRAAWKVSSTSSGRHVRPLPDSANSPFGFARRDQCSDQIRSVSAAPQRGQRPSSR